VANRKERRAAARSKDSNDTDNAAVEPDAVLGGGAEGFGEGEAMPFPDHEEDVLFKTQMRVLNLLLGHWKTGLAVVGAALLGVLIVGEYNEYLTSQQRDFQGEIADVDRRMPASSPTERLGFDGMGITDEVKANVEEGARRYAAVGGSASGTASTMAWLRAGAAWERVGAHDKAMAAYGSAHTAGAEGLLGWSAASQFASTQAASGDVDGAIATLRSLSGRVSGLTAEHAEMGVATILEDAGRAAESKAAFSAFLVAHPDSVLIGQANDGIHRLGAAG
jgi:hypothetical protein